MQMPFHSSWVTQFLWQILKGGCMTERLKYHFEPKTGWMNDPNGLIEFQGRYHAFFQYNPCALECGQMHWGHAASRDLIHWEELPIALYPDMPYENDRGCFSGSAIEKDGILYLYYTSVSHEMGQTQSIAMSSDGVNFVKYDKNPVIPHYPIDGCEDFRDPKVVQINDAYYMVCGSGKNGAGKVLLYKSEDLFDWTYAGVLFESTEYGAVLECPDFFQLDDRFVLMFSKMGMKTHATQFIIGDFINDTFIPASYATPEAGPQFYAPQTFMDSAGRRIMIGWLYDWNKELDEGAEFAGALTIPRELKIKEHRILNFPVSEAHSLLAVKDDMVHVSDGCVCINAPNLKFPLRYNGNIEDVQILKDTKTIEVFINEGEASFTCWFNK